jgi:hypothetical protein
MSCFYVKALGTYSAACRRGLNSRHESTELLPQEGNNPSHEEYPKQTPWPLVRERTIPTERPPLVDEI